jgi:predicted SprT family Zn-dependent metalloprotease
VQALPDKAALYRRADELGRVWQIPNFSGRVDIDYSWTMRTRAGYADLLNYKVRLNARLLQRHPAEIDDTLVHELAHIAAVMLCGQDIRHHGPEWQSLMRIAGYEPERTHNLDVGDLRQERKRYLYLHRCDGCGAHRVSRRWVRQWVCASCKPGRLSVWRVSDNAAGRRKLAELAAAGR